MGVFKAISSLDDKLKTYLQAEKNKNEFFCIWEKTDIIMKYVKGKVNEANTNFLTLKTFEQKWGTSYYLTLNHKMI